MQRTWSWSQRIRQAHRWVAVAFTVAVVVTFVALSRDEPAVWVSYVPLLPLALLQISGLYLLAQPYVARYARRRSAGG